MTGDWRAVRNPQNLHVKPTGERLPREATAMSAGEAVKNKET